LKIEENFRILNFLGTFETGTRYKRNVHSFICLNDYLVTC